MNTQLVNVSNSLKNNSREVYALQQFLQQELELDTKAPSTSLLSKIQSTSGIDKLDAKFAHAVKVMESTAITYENGVDATKRVVADFLKLRNDIDGEYRKAVSELKLILGPRVKTIDPELFDFSRVSYLDGKAIFQEMSSSYGAFHANALIYKEEIVDNFKKKMEEAKKASSKNLLSAADAGKKWLESKDQKSKNEAKMEIVLELIAATAKGLVKVGSHYLDAHKRKLILEEEYESFKGKALSSYAEMQKDSIRVDCIYQNIENCFIPRSKIFFENFEKVYIKEISSLTTSIYSTPAAQKLKIQQEELLEKLKEKRNEVVFAEYELSKKENEIKTCKEAIAQEAPTYALAKKQEPFLKTSILILILVSSLLLFTLSMSTVFIVANIACIVAAFVFAVFSTKKFVNWKKLYGEFCIKHKERIVLVKQKENDILPVQVTIKNLESECKQIDSDIQSNAEAIVATVSIDESIRENVSTNLENVVRLLRTGKMILESKIDDQNLVPMEQKSSIESEKSSVITEALTEKIKNGLEEKMGDAKEELSGYLQNAQSNALDLINKKFKINDDDNEEAKKRKQKALKNSIAILEKKYSRTTEIATVALDASVEISNGLLSVLSSLAKLNELKCKNSMVEQEKVYEYGEMLRKFEFDFMKLDREFVEIQKTSHAIQTAQEHETLLDLLTTLCGYSELSQNEIDDFLDGKSDLVI